MATKARTDDAELVSVAVQFDVGEDELSDYILDEGDNPVLSIPQARVVLALLSEHACIEVSAGEIAAVIHGVDMEKRPGLTNPDLSDRIHPHEYAAAIVSFLRGRGDLHHEGTKGTKEGS